MIAYKFLDAGGRGRFSGFAWPRPSERPSGMWVEAEPDLCASGIHACRVQDLPFWLDVELWRIEVAGEVVAANHKIVVGRARLLEQVVTWDEAAMLDFSTWSAERTRERAGSAENLRAYAADAAKNAETGSAAVVGYIAARVAEIVTGEAGYDAERVLQAQWLADRLRLDLDRR